MITATEQEARVDATQQRPSQKDTASIRSPRIIGEIIQAAKNLSDQDLRRIVELQAAERIRFGEAAIRLGLASPDDVLWALSQQFHYPYSDRTASQISPEVFVATRPFSEEAEIFRDLRSQLLPVMSTGATRRALAVTSTNVGDGKTFFAANLAVSFSQIGGRTLLIDADMRTPRQHQVFNCRSTNGLSSVLSGRIDPDVIQPIPEIPSLFLMPVGITPPNPLELLHRSAFSHLIRELATKFDQIIIDTPAAQHGADAKVIATNCGLALVVGRRARTSLADLSKMKDAFERGRCQIAGVVMNEH